MYCRKCGTANPEDRTTCIQCNAPISAPLPSRTLTPEQQSAPTSQTQAFSNPVAPTQVVSNPPPQPSGSQPASDWGASNQTQVSPAYQQNYKPQPPTPSYGLPNQQPALNYGAGPQVSPRLGTNQLAIISAVCGVLGLFTCLCIIFIFPSIAGIVTGFLALNKVKETGEKGRELAIAGMVTGGLGIVLWIIYIIV